MAVYLGYFYLWQLILFIGIPLSFLLAIVILEIFRKDLIKSMEKPKTEKDSITERHLPLKRRHLPLFKQDNSWVLRHVEEETKTKIMFIFDSMRRPERQLLITGPLEGVAKADKMIRKAVQNKSDIDVYEMCIDMSIMEKFVGKEAEVIKDIQGSTGTCIMIRCEIDPLTGPLGKVIITGTCKEISKAIPLVEDKLKNFDESKVTKRFGYPEKIILVPRIRMLDLVIVGSEIHVHVVPSLIINPQHFYVQVESLQDVEGKKLRNEMNDFYNNPDNRKLLAMHDIQKGHVVALKDVDGNWQRCEVLEVYDNHCTVMFIDVGGEVTINVRDILELPQHFTKYIVQAYECTLNNIGETLGGWTSKTVAKFKELCTLKPSEKLCMHIRNTKIVLEARGFTRKHICVVDLYNEGVNVGSKLRKEGHAVLENTMTNYFKEIPRRDERKLSDMLDAFRIHKEMNEDIDEEFREKLEFNEYESDDDFLPEEHASLSFLLDKWRENKTQKNKAQKNKAQKNKALKETERKEAERKEAERKEAERKEAERKETERKEKERKEKECKEKERKEKKLKERKLKEKELKEKELKERELKERELKERELKERELKERELKEKELKEKELKEKELKEKELKETELTETKKAGFEEAEYKEAEYKEAEYKEAESEDTEYKETESEDTEYKEVESEGTEYKETD